MPSAAPSMSLVPSLVPTDNCGNFRIEVQGDRCAGAHTSFKVFDENQRVIYSGDSFIANQNRMIDICLPKEETYTFTIYDWDGLCCDCGDGYYKLYLNDNLIREGAEFSNSESTEIPVCITQECFER